MTRTRLNFLELRFGFEFRLGYAEVLFFKLTALKPFFIIATDDCLKNKDSFKQNYLCPWNYVGDFHWQEQTTHDRHCRLCSHFLFLKCNRECL